MSISTGSNSLDDARYGNVGAGPCACPQDAGYEMRDVGYGNVGAGPCACPPDLSKIVQSYKWFEKKVQVVIKGFCAPFCTSCKGVCCSPDYCRETLESPFLSLVRKTYPPRTGYSETDGWLTESGCALTAGRAPVCYEFLCNRILNALIDQTALYMLRVLSHLMNHAGRIGPGRRHVVELLRMKELEKLMFWRFEKRLTESEDALAVIRSFQEKKPVPENSPAMLAKIVRPTNRNPAVPEAYAVSAIYPSLW